MIQQERKTTVLTLKRTCDPEMGQELYTFNCMLNKQPKKKVIESRRLIWMDGSDSDDEDQHSWCSVRKEIEN
jgi:hypothetical protein